MRIQLLQLLVLLPDPREVDILRRAARPAPGRPAARPLTRRHDCSRLQRSRNGAKRPDPEHSEVVWTGAKSALIAEHAARNLAAHRHHIARLPADSMASHQHEGLQHRQPRDLRHLRHQVPRSITPCRQNARAQVHKRSGQMARPPERGANF